MSKRDRANFREFNDGVSSIYIGDDAPKIEVRGAIGTLILCIQDSQNNQFWIEMEDFYGAHLAHDLIDMTRDIDEYDDDGELR